MSVIQTRSHQMFPVLDAGQVETAKRFASGPPGISRPASRYSTRA
jgi:thioredoxin reductase (NADPH)